MRNPDPEEDIPSSVCCPALPRSWALAIPMLLLLVLVTTLAILFDTTRSYQILGLVFLYLFPPVSKETIIPAAIASGFSWQVISFSITWLDAATCLFILWNFDLICRIPGIGRWISCLAQSDNEFLTRHQWIERMCFLGLTAFMLLPIQGSGAIGGTILGRILGMNRISIAVAVIIGSAVHSVVLGISVSAIKSYQCINIWYFVLLSILVIVIPSVVTLLKNIHKKRL